MPELQDEMFRDVMDRMTLSMSDTAAIGDYPVTVANETQVCDRRGKDLPSEERCCFDQNNP